MPFARGLLGKQAGTRIESKQVAVDQRRSTSRYRSGWDVERAMREGLERVMWIFRCADAIALAQIKLPILVRKQDRLTGERIPNHFLLDLLNGYPNEFEDAAGWRYRLSMQFLLSERGVFIEQIFSNAGNLIGLHLLPPQFIYAIPDAKRFVKRFEMRVPGKDTIEIPTDRVLWIKKTHPTDPYRSLTPLEGLGISIDIYWLARIYNRNFVANDARPGGVLLLTGEVDSEDDIDEVRERFGTNPGRVSVLTSESGTWIDTAVNPRDAQFLELLKYAKDEFLIAFGVPESQLGNASGRTFDNADAEDLVFHEKTMPGHLEFLGRGLDRLDGDPQTFVVFDTSEVPVLQRAKEKRDAAQIKAFVDGGQTLNDLQTQLGQPQFDDPAADFVWLPVNKVPVAARTPGGVPARPAAAAAGVRSRKDLAETADELEEKRREVIARTHASRMAADERMLEREFRRYFTRQEKVVLAKLNGKAGERALANGGLTVETVFDIDEWDAQLRDDAEDMISDLVRDWGQAVLDVFNEDEEAAIEPDDVEAKAQAEEKARARNSFDLNDPAVQKIIKQQVDKVVGINRTTLEALRDTISEGSAEGETLRQIAKRIRAVFQHASTVRALTIARTEILSAANGGLYFGAIQSGVAEKKTWLTAGDDRVRHTHQDAAGQTVPIDQPFTVGGEELRYPGDPGGSAAEVINCRCSQAFTAGTGILATSAFGAFT